MRHLFLFVIVLFLIAAFFRVDVFFYILYFLFGVLFFSRLWAARALEGITFEREYAKRAFLGEHILVTLRIRNRGILPLLWLHVHETVPIQLKSPGSFASALSMLPYETKVLAYELDCYKRGYYPLGPLRLSAGDPFGDVSHEGLFPRSDAAIVYPRIVPLTDLGLPAQTPFGEVPTQQRIFEDPTRMIGVRQYQSGDSTRLIHWKTTAATGTLQVKRFQPAISIEAQVFLNLSRREYTGKRGTLATELAIVTAASVANCLIEKRQTAGLCCNGIDPLVEGDRPVSLPPRRGREQLMHILDLLARIQVNEHAQVPFSDLLRQASLHLTWGGTGIIITSHADDPLFDSMILMKRSGFHVVLVLVDPGSPFAGTRRRAHEIGIRAYQVTTEKDLDVWR